ncbi:MAG: TRAP transporter substrate-binding protein DctP [Defluviicoccus sp.]|nr:TRAP transporter substrate-binding protein DctP [Defluviicoccus sp.]MDE0385474.1 TRAP transporter substrate-binding protein DctP [Defluviicoccus sp.]
MSRSKTARALLAAAVLWAGASTASAEVKLNLVYPFPDFLIYTKQCKQLAADITAAAKGKLAINVLPFNSIKMFQQPPAVRKGRVDLYCGPYAFFARAVPENEAVATSPSNPAIVRANGGLKMLDELQQKYFGVKNLGWTSAGGRFRIYMANAPRFNDKGMLDLDGVKLRDNPIYGAFFRAMNATTHPLPATQVYSALEKGVVDAAAWATIGLKGLKWDKFLRHAVEPEFYHTDIGWFINLKTWNSLDSALRKQVQDMVIANETAVRKVLLEESKKERAMLAKEGMKFHTVPAATVYSKLAVDSAYGRMMDRLKKAKRPTEHVAKLRELWQQQ